MFPGFRRNREKNKANPKQRWNWPDAYQELSQAMEIDEAAGTIPNCDSRTVWRQKSAANAM